MGEDFLFVYGTLRPDLAPEPVARAFAGARRLGTARVAGRLYDLGAYPGARLDGHDGEEIEGEVLEVPDLASWLPLLDRYEGCVADDPGASLFHRRRCEARLESGRLVPCVVYEIAAEPPRERRIASGRWRP